MKLQERDVDGWDFFAFKVKLEELEYSYPVCEEDSKRHEECRVM